MNRSTHQKTVLITGADGGLGRAVTHRLLNEGWNVLSADIASSGSSDATGKFPIPVFLDVTNPDSIATAADIVAGHCDGLDGLVHLSGTLEIGSLLEMDETTLWRVLQVNLLGCIRVDRTFFPMIQKRKGRIVHVSSETGWQSGAPFNGAYGMSKHALECYSDSLRRELQMLKIRVIRLQPGPFRTQMTQTLNDRFERLCRDTRLFKPFAKRIRTLAARETHRLQSPDVFSTALFRALTDRRPRPIQSIRPNFYRCLLELFPTTVADAIFRTALTPR